jgi:hypothetical protein
MSLQSRWKLKPVLKDTSDLPSVVSSPDFACLLLRLLLLLLLLLRRRLLLLMMMMMQCMHWAHPTPSCCALHCSGAVLVC